MNGSRVLAAEFAVALGFVSWGAIKHGYWPWPPTVAKLGIGFAVMGLIAQLDEGIAATLAGGFLLALFMKEYQKGIGNYQGGVNSTNSMIYPILIGSQGPTNTSQPTPKVG